MKKKILNFILAICLIVPSVFLMTACDLFGGDDVDTKLYHLTLSYSSNVDFEQDELVATFAFGERHDIKTRPQDDVDQYLDAGASQTDISKTGVKQSDGSYYFFDSDPIIISAPQGEDAKGYRFLGFFDKSTNECVYMPKLTKCQLDDGSTELLMKRWNMLDRDVELEARYSVLKYDISYVDDKGLITNPINPTQYDGSNAHQVVDLIAPAKSEGLKFDHWYYKQIIFGINDLVEQKEVECPSLPEFYDEGIFEENGQNLKLTVYAKYEDEYYKPTVVIKDGVGTTITGLEDCLTLKALDSSGGEISLAESYKYGTEFGVSVDVAKLEIANYEFQGIYVDGVKIPDLGIGGGETRLNNVLEPFLLTKDVNIEIKVSLCSH